MAGSVSERTDSSTSLMSNDYHAPLTTMASATLFGSILFATAALATRFLVLGDYRPFQAALNPRSAALDIRSLTSVYTFLQHTSVFGLILFYAYVCENHPPFPHSEKHYDADQFFFLTALLFVVSAFTMTTHDTNNHKKNAAARSKVSSVESGAPLEDREEEVKSGVVAEANDATEILNRDQTEEWKGWMQFMFLLYHYYHAEEVYNAIRIMITCYVWMTGFGNLSFFYITSDYGIVRVIQMLWRLNFLVLFLCLTQGTTYILYYICLLHTYYFLVVYVIMRIGSHKNHTKWWIRIKLAVLALIIFVVWDMDSGLFRVIHYPFLGDNPKMGATHGTMWEWYFRSSLDHWSTFFGMLFALNFPVTSLFFRKLEAQPLVYHVLAKLAMAAGLFTAFWLWVTGPFQLAKVQYNQTNAYFGFIPLVAYIFFRNLTPRLRSCNMELLHQIGKTTLETYLMQHHIWLTSNAKSLLTLIPGWPKMNFLIVSLLYVFLSRRLYQLTLFLRGMILPDDRSTCFRNLAGMAVVILGNVLVAFCLATTGWLTLNVVGFLAVVFGVMLYLFLVNLTTPLHDTPASDSNKKSHGGLTGLTSPPLVGAAVIVLLGVTLHGISSRGAARIQRLHANCSPFANNGAWIPVDGCEEGGRGSAYRYYGIAPVTTCSVQNHGYVWGWNETKPSSHCRFAQRDVNDLKRTLRRRSVAFVGDSITRYVYNSFLRQVGFVTAGAYNTTGEKHADVHMATDSGYLDFEWAPYVKDQIEKVKEISKLPLDPSDTSSRKRPDLLVLGGGAWDRLWNYSSDSERLTFRNAVADLAVEIQQLRSLRVPVVWVVPTTINNNALNSPEKRANIPEEEMELIRALHESQGILSSSSFVLDGPSFTASRVAESFDGVHYPHQVYTAGAQILANSLDWLLGEPVKGDPPKPPHPGLMAHGHLGLMMFCFIFFGLVGFDGFYGFSYLASIFVPSVSPRLLYKEAFSALHRKKNLPEIEAPSLPPSRSTSRSPSRSRSSSKSDHEEETDSLLSKEF
jgi:N-acetylneuraminate 9-O-acetyltransferase